MSQPKMKVLAMGLPRTGTASMAAALEILGYNNVYHGLKSIDNPDDWKIWDKAASASFPTLPSYTGKPFTQDEWEELFGDCEGTSDMSAPFGRTIVEAYPEAKVVLVIRDFNGWWKSFNEGVVEGLWGFFPTISVEYLEPILGSVAGPASRKIIQGFFRSNNPKEFKNLARQAYDRHHQEVRDAVPPEQFLEFRLAEGWEPLCAFLDKPVPEVPFPRINEAAALKEKISQKIKENFQSAAKKVAPWVVGVAAVAVGAWSYARS